MNLKEMFARQRQLIELAKSESRGLTDAEQEEFDNLQRQIDELIDSRERGNPEDETGEAGEQRAALEERTRISSINSLCRQFGVDPEPYVSGGHTIDQVRKEVLEQLQRTGSPVSARVTEDAEDKRRNAIADGILLRNNISITNPAPGSNEFRGASLRTIAASCLVQEGNTEGRNFYMMDPNELFEETLRRSYYNPTSAFPAIMDQVINKAYVEGHKTAAVTFDQFTTKGTLSDFKKADNYYVQGSFGEFLEVPKMGN